MLNEVFQHLDDSAPVTESQLAERCGLRQDFLNDVLTILAQLDVVEPSSQGYLKVRGMTQAFNWELVQSVYSPGFMAATFEAASPKRSVLELLCDEIIAASAENKLVADIVGRALAVAIAIELKEQIASSEFVQLIQEKVD